MIINQSQARRGLLNPSTMLRTLCHNRIMVWQFIKRSIQLQHKGSAFGIGWMVLSPLLLFGVYVLVFMFVFKGKYGVIPNETSLDFAIGLFLSLTLIQLIQETMAGAPLCILQNPNYVKKVVFPLEILPVVNFGAAFLRCLVALSLVLVAAVVSGPGLTPLVCWLPVLVLMFSLFSVGVAWILAALGVFMRDLAPFMQFLTQILAFVSGVFYSHNNLPAEFSFLRFNPIMVVIELSRDVVLWHVAPDVGSLVYLGVVSCLTCVVGYALFSALKPAFADVV